VTVNTRLTSLPGRLVHTAPPSSRSGTSGVRAQFLAVTSYHPVEAMVRCSLASGQNKAGQLFGHRNTADHGPGLYRNDQVTSAAQETQVVKRDLNVNQVEGLPFRPHKLSCRIAGGSVRLHKPSPSHYQYKGPLALSLDRHIDRETPQEANWLTVPEYGTTLLGLHKVVVSPLGLAVSAHSYTEVTHHYLFS